MIYLNGSFTHNPSKSNTWQFHILVSNCFHLNVIVHSRLKLNDGFMFMCQLGIYFNCPIKSIELVPKSVMLNVVRTDDFGIEGHDDLIGEPKLSGIRGVLTCSILASIVTILGKNCGITNEYWANTWKMCSPASETLARIDTKFVCIIIILASM